MRRGRHRVAAPLSAATCKSELERMLRRFEPGAPEGRAAVLLASFENKAQLFEILARRFGFDLVVGGVGGGGGSSAVSGSGGGSGGGSKEEETGHARTVPCDLCSAGRWLRLRFVVRRERSDKVVASGRWSDAVYLPRVEQGETTHHVDAEVWLPYSCSSKEEKAQGALAASSPSSFAKKRLAFALRPLLMRLEVGKEGEAGMLLKW